MYHSIPISYKNYVQTSLHLCLHCSDEFLICGVSLHVSSFYHSACHEGVELGMDVLRCFVFAIFLYFFCINF